ncbi:MAG TPA: FtsX-like permease family protein [Steroidobacteraceae bacterium]|nr:FtsX-like permease family protein [Steroidobacteraceae bacterium]
MDISHILSSLRRSPTGAILVALQIALALAIVVNSLYIVIQRLEMLNADHGMDVPNLFTVGWTVNGDRFNGEATMREDLAILRGLPGVVSATVINAIPLSGGGSSNSLYTEPNEKGREGRINYFNVDEYGARTLGVEIVEGRDVDPSVVRKPPRNTTSFPPQILLTREAAKDLFPEGSALGKTVYTSLSQPATIVGIIDHMHGSWPSWEHFGNVALVPEIADEQYARYLVRAEPGRRDELMKRAEEALRAVDNGRVILRTRSLEYIAASTYADDRAMAVYMTVVIGLLLGIAALGIFGLAAFNVGTRTKQIGTRRAVGARRLDILRYFLAENWLITTVGVVAGCVLALVLGYWLSTTFELPRLKLYYLAGGALVLWLVSLAATLKPARRAARVSPAVATRTV